MVLHGRHMIGFQAAASGPGRFAAVNPATGATLAPEYCVADPGDIDRAMRLAEDAFAALRLSSGEQRGQLLDRIAANIDALGDALIERGTQETALPAVRLIGERARTTGQLRLFGQLVREGSWVDARIDTAQPQRQPLPRPDLRRMLVPLGPVVVFSASNFPLAFSVAGGDTASALAAGCPVVVKAHWGHPGVSELVAGAVIQAVRDLGLPEGTFSLLQGRGHAIGVGLVRHPAARAVGFTGSHTGGRALFDAAVSRPDPIPVYAEMGSINPVLILPGALRQRLDAIAEGLVQSVNLGVGQFCTSPGLVVGLAGEGMERLIEKVGRLFRGQLPQSMLYGGLCEAFHQGVARLEGMAGVLRVGRSEQEADTARAQARPTVFRTDAATFIKEPALGQEVFGPATLFVVARDAAELRSLVTRLDGQLTATLHHADSDLVAFPDLPDLLTQRVGRLIHNGFPTGVEVCPAMNHGGPYPATTDSHFTSVGTAAILRFARPICFQNAPAATLPPALRNENPLGILRLVNGQYTRDALA